MMENCLENKANIGWKMQYQRTVQTLQTTLMHVMKSTKILVVIVIANTNKYSNVNKIKKQWPIECS